MSRLYFIALLLPFAFSASNATAAYYELGVKAGLSSFSVTAGGGTYKKDSGMGGDIRPQVDMQFPNLNFSTGLYFQGHIGSEIGSFPLGIFGFECAYYPIGLPIVKDLVDNGVHVMHNRLAPFISGGANLTNISVTDANAGPTLLTFNALAIGFQLGAGVDMPVSENTSFLLELLYFGTLIGGGTAQSSSSTSTISTPSASIQYSGVGVMFGVMIHP